MVNIKGTLTPTADANISIKNRGLEYGDAVFETLKIVSREIFFWEDHYLRLMSSMRILRMEIPMTFTMEYLEAEILKTVEKSEKKSEAYRVKIIVWRQTGGKYTPDTNEIDFAISTEPLQNPFYELNNDLYEVELFKDHYIYSGMLSTLKTTNKISHVLGSIFAKENEYQNCLLLNENKNVVEALNGNIFIVKDAIIKTPPIEDGCLQGIFRKKLLEIVAEMPDFELEIASISPFELQKADEIFITNIILGIQPISKYRKKEFKYDVAKLLLTKVNLKLRVKN